MKIKILNLLLGLSLVAGCAATLPNPLAAPKTKRDLKRVELQPGSLTYRPKSLLILTSPLQGDEANILFHFSEQLFKKQAGLQTIEQNLLSKLVKGAEYKEFNPRNLMQSLALAKSLSADYLLLTRKTLHKGEETTYFQLIQRTTTERIFEAKLPWPPRVSGKLEQRIQEKFPLKGQILETRGNGQFAKISLGKSFGVQLGRTFMIKAKNQAPPIKGKVIQVLENESWLEIELKDREQIMIGLEAQSRPTGSWLF